VEPQDTEKRQSRPSRIPAQLRVEIGGKTPQEGYTINISQNGLLLAVPHDHEIDSFVTLKIHLPPQEELFEVLGRVASKVTAEGKEAIGIHFNQMATSRQSRWLEYISKVASLVDSGEDSDRRQDIRMASSYVVRFKSKESAKEFLAKNLSTGGMFLATTALKKLGDKIKFVIVHPLKHETFELNAEVVRIDGQDSPDEIKGMALRFLSMTSKKKTRLKRFMESG